MLDRERIALDQFAQPAAERAGQGRTIVHVAVEDRAAGVIAIADAPRESAVEAVRTLRSLGIRR
jgi:P-type Cu2+ transporter